MLVHVALDFRDDAFNHTLAEVWVNDSLGKWVLIDADYNTLYLVDDVPASMIEMHEVVQKGEFDRISFERNGSTSRPIPALWDQTDEQRKPSKLLRSFKHLYFALTNAFFDGYEVKLIGKKRVTFVHYTDANAPPYPEMKKRVFMLLSLVGVFFCVSRFI